MNKPQNTERAAVHERVRRIRIRLSRWRRRTTNGREASQTRGERTLRQLMPEMQLLEAINNAMHKR